MLVTFRFDFIGLWCCGLQVAQYREQGQNKAGLSAIAYYNKVTNFGNHHTKQLNWIYVSRFEW